MTDRLSVISEDDVRRRRNLSNRFVANKWVVYILSVLVTIVDVGMLFSLGVLFVPMLDKYRGSRPATALVQSLMIGMTGLGIISGLLVAKYGLRKVSFVGSVLTSSGFIFAYFATSVSHLYLLISLLAGTGVVNLLMCATVAVGQLFEGRARLTAVAVQMSGIGIGAVSYPYLLRYLIYTYGINGTFLILGGLYLNNICVVILYGKVRVKYTGQRDEGKDCKFGLSHSERQMENPCNACLCCQSWIARFKKEMLSILSMPYVFMLIATTLGQSSLDGYQTVYVDIYIWKTFTEDQGTTSVLSYQICIIFFRILAGLVNQIKGFDSLSIPVTGTLLGCGGVVVIYFSKSHMIAYIGSGLLGVSAAGLIAGSGIAVAELVQDEQFGTAYGLVLTAIAVFSIFTGPIFGAIRDGTQSYALVLFVIGLMHIAAAVLYLIALVWRRLSKRRAEITVTKLANE